MARKRKKQVPAHRSGCPIAISLDLFGDRWSLLIVRDILFAGPRGYRDFAASGEGIATNILADRLARLEAAGIIRRARDRDDGRKWIYDLTDKGIALTPVVAEMILWAAHHEETEAPPAIVASIETRREEFVAGIRQHWAARNARAT